MLLSESELPGLAITALIVEGVLMQVLLIGVGLVGLS